MSVFKPLTGYFEVAGIFCRRKFSEAKMAKILETISKRRTIKLSVEDVIAVIRHYQRVTRGNTNATIVRDLIESANFYLPEDV